MRKYNQHYSLPHLRAKAASLKETASFKHAKFTFLVFSLAVVVPRIRQL